jgi:serine/threonine protein kinase
MTDRVGQQFGNYRLVQMLGRGGQAEVYLGEHCYLKSLAALKFLHTALSDDQVARFLEEARTLVRLKHAHIVRVLDFLVERGTPVLIMDYAPEGALRTRHPAGSRLPLATVVAYVQQIAEALQYAHTRDVIHRDVKPDNLLLGSDQQILLGDFGLAVLTPSPDLLSTQQMAGTIPYMAPEQFQGKPCFASDQYALGIIVYEWLCGARPFTGTPWETIQQHLSAPLLPLREKNVAVPEAVEAVLLKVLSKNPRDRYASVQSFARALARAAQGSTHDPLNTVTAAPLVQQVVISASPADESFAARLKADLQARGVSLWQPDAAVTVEQSKQQETIRQAIRTASLVLVVLSPQTRSSRTANEHMRLAKLYERYLIFVWASGEELDALLPVPQTWGKIGAIDVIDARGASYKKALEEIVASLQGEDMSVSTVPLATYVEPVEEPRNPYKGLRAFTRDDAVDFFGRETLIQELVDSLQRMLSAETAAASEARLLSVMGASGSGKSSVMLAGLLPRLQDGALPCSQEWLYLKPMLPATHPIESLALTLAPHMPKRSLAIIREDLQDDAARGLHLLAAHLAARPGVKVVLLVDQFEELFTQTIAEEERQRFIDLLVTAVTEPHGPLLVLLTLRADFYDRLLSYPVLFRLIQGHQHVLLPMDLQDLRAVIEQPAALPDAQLSFAGNLVGDLLFEAQGQAGALPMLEFTLDQLFQKRSGHLLTLQAYHEIGGVKGALAQQAETTYLSLPSDEHRRLARALFLRLLDPGLSEQDTRRRRAALAELSLPDVTQTSIMHAIADSFIAARLLMANETAGTTTIEVSHEALIREWPRLTDWLREGRDDIRLQQAISEDVAAWEQRGQPNDRLYRGSQLAEAKAWAKRSIPSETEAAFLRNSSTLRMRSVATIIIVVLLLLSTAGVAGWLLFLLPSTQVTNLNDAGPGSLRQAINTANAGSTITFDSHLSGTILLRSGNLNISKNLTIRGPGTSKLAISSGSRGFAIQVDATASVSTSHLAFKNSIVKGTGSGSPESFITNLGMLTLTNCIVSGNTSGVGIADVNYTYGDQGGGIFNSGTLTLASSAVFGNIAVGQSNSGNGLGGAGGGIYNLGTLTLKDSTVSDNSAMNATSNASSSLDNGGQGGGIDNLGTLTLINSAVSRNRAYGGKNTTTGFGINVGGSGGGIENEGNQLTIINSTISNNTASEGKGHHTGAHGGGIDNRNGIFIVASSTISHNTASGSDSHNGGYGGGIYNQGNTLTVTNSTISDNSTSGGSVGDEDANSAQDTGDGGGSGGGGIVNSIGANLGGLYKAGRLILTNSTITGNTSSSSGGGIINWGSQATIAFSTIYGNKAANGGGLAIENGRGDVAIKNEPGAFQLEAIASHVQMRNSIVAANHAPTGPDIAGKFTSDGYNLIQDVAGATFTANPSDVSANPSTDLKIDPQLSGQSPQTHVLLPGSPAIDRIPLAACLIDGITTDERGMKRPDDNETACDIGAYESAH